MCYRRQQNSYFKLNFQLLSFLTVSAEIFWSMRYKEHFFKRHSSAHRETARFKLNSLVIVNLKTVSLSFIQVHWRVLGITVTLHIPWILLLLLLLLLLSCKELGFTQALEFFKISLWSEGVTKADSWECFSSCKILIDLLLLLLLLLLLC